MLELGSGQATTWRDLDKGTLVTYAQRAQDENNALRMNLASTMQWAKQMVPEHVGPVARTITTVGSGAAAAAIMGLFGKWGLLGSAGLAGGALVGALVAGKENPDLRDACLAVATGQATAVTAIETYKGVLDWAAKRAQSKSTTAAAAAAATKQA